MDRLSGDRLSGDDNGEMSFEPADVQIHTQWPFLAGVQDGGVVGGCVVDLKNC